MKISFITYHQPYKNYASSRIRCLYPSRAIPGAHLGYTPGADVYVISKAISEQDYHLVRSQKPGATVVYDLTDPVFDQGGFQVLVDLCDLVTVPTETLKEQVSRHTKKPCFVWPDCIDYAVTEPLPATHNCAVAWYGNHNTISATVDDLMQLAKHHTVYVITNPTMISMNSGIRVVEWNYDTFPVTLRKAGLCLLNHQEGDQDYKSNNKMITSIALGLPVISNRGKAYRELIDQYDLDHFKFDDLANDMDTRTAYLNQCQADILNQFNYKATAAALMEILI